MTGAFLVLVIVFVAGFYWSALAGIDGGSRIPGDLADNRFNNYILEHVYEWLLGKHALWDAPFFYPFPDVLAFSSNHLGSVLFYAAFRQLGFDIQTAFQCWYLLSFALNYCAAAFALQRLKLSALAISFGAFVFSFNMVLVEESGHAQLLYRFAVPLACLSLWKLAEERRLKHLVWMALWVTWQFAIEIYLGFLLSLLLAALGCAIALFGSNFRFWESARFWPSRIGDAWRSAQASRRLVLSCDLALIALALVLLFLPYLRVTHSYGFHRTWDEVAPSLPRLTSYLRNWHSTIYKFPSSWFTESPIPWEHQLLLGFGTLGAIALAAVKKSDDARLFAQEKINLLALLGLFVFTLYMGDYSPYRLIMLIPGFSAMRAIGRIILIELWPVSVVCAITVESMISSKTRALWWRMVATIIVLVTLGDVIFMKHPGYLKTVAAQRLARYEKLLPPIVPSDPILFLAVSPDVTNAEKEILGEIDAMLLSQQLGWPTLNGYSGNDPPISSNHPFTCSVYPRRIASVLAFERQLNEQAYLQLAQRVVPVGFRDCAADWQERMPPFTASTGPLPDELFKNLRVSIVFLKAYRNRLQVELQLDNESSLALPSMATDGRQFRLAARILDVKASAPDPWVGFDSRADLDFDVPARKRIVQSVWLPLPARTGQFYVEASGVQEYTAWLHDRGVPITRSNATLEVVDGFGQIRAASVSGGK